MQLGPTIDGRIKIAITDENDFNFFAAILQDALGEDSPQSIVDQISKGKGDEDWEEFVKPDLVTQFKKEILTVGSVLAETQDNGLKEFFIEESSAGAWFSTLNQARLHLEQVHKISSFEDEIDEENLSETQLQSLAKYDLYTNLQGLILETSDF